VTKRLPPPVQQFQQVPQYPVDPVVDKLRRWVLYTLVAAVGGTALLMILGVLIRRLF